ncbi:carboxypeptidase regulatory-like domain-containing protein [Polaribacter haliotis]|uniref:Carboxypeptidase regulatory-like domain-containing protein n=1 Tax=Polaribacter haliotis TaxID=1888915 RepID=A0A7L8ADZ3_9FLAO|nr:TonB-dependent receptor [Polaribacter haliotis]QOD60079.1 carboxypeptidase regulatory-like domain-containing protein [Polaribacter haliotis]
MKHFKNLLFVALFFVTATVLGQGVTSSSIGGKITDDKNETLPGANVLAIHTPTGTRYGASTDFDGFFRISNMKSGGPYKITISYVGYKTYIENNIMLGLGGSKKFNISLNEDANALDEIIVRSQNNGIFGADKNGSETNISQKDIQKLPSISRGIADFVRLTPQAQITGDNQISIAGQNNRYNAIYIDGAVNNDVFGLASSGTNGGQTGVNPFSIDAIESFQVSVAPFDVKISGFAGGAISAVTRSGTNNFEGSVYSFFRNENLAGKTPFAISETNRKKLNEFSALTYGLRVGGPIVEDKLFFFVNYERQNDETPQPFDVSNYVGDSNTTDLNNLSDFLQNTYNYNPGGFEDNLNKLESHKLIAKLDWNIDEKHTLSLKHSYVKAEQISANSSNNSNINFYNTAIKFPSVTNSTSLEINSRFSDKISNNFVIGYTSVNDDRDPFGTPFPFVNIEDGEGRIRLGSEQFSTANLLEQSILTITDNVEIFSGKHKITIGTHNEFSSAKNLFFANNFGYYEYDSVSDFIAGGAPSNYQRGYSLISPGAGNDSSGSADFSVAQLGIYFQDEIDITDDFKLSAGLRFDLPIWEDGIANEDFNTRTVSLLGEERLQGARVGKKVSTNVHFSPRVGFNWNVKGESKTQIRGGIGVFTSRLPLVWPGGTYNNNGVTGGYYFTNSGVNSFTADVNNQPVDVLPGSGSVGGDIDLFAPDFKLPQVLKYNLAVDQKLPGGFILSGDFIYNDNISAINYQNINLQDPTTTLTGTGDNRPLWNRGSSGRVDSTYGSIILASNTSEGSSWNTSLSLRKTTPFYGLTGGVTYSYGDSKNIFEGTSSQNKSQWRNQLSVNGKNRSTIGRSQFAQGHRFFSNLSYEYEWNENAKTTVSVFYEGNQGRPYSHIYREGRDLLNDDSRDNALIYIPINQSDIVLKDGENGFTSAEQWAALDKFISNDEYLNSRRGQYAERNAQFAPWSHIIDMKLLQDFSLNIGEKKHTFQATFDIFNFTNLLNKKWGVRKFVSNFGEASVLTNQGFDTDGTTPIFSFNPDNTNILTVDDSGLQSSRWQMQIGIRYIFK